MRRYRVLTYSAVEGYTRAGCTYPKGTHTRYIITDRTEAEVAMAKTGSNHNTEEWATMIFPITAYEDADTQQQRVKLMLNYLNKIVDAQEKAVLGAEIGFL